MRLEPCAYSVELITVFLLSVWYQCPFESLMRNLFVATADGRPPQDHGGRYVIICRRAIRRRFRFDRCTGSSPGVVGRSAGLNFDQNGSL